MAFVVLVQQVVLLLLGSLLGVRIATACLKLLLDFALSPGVAVPQLVLSDQRALFHLESALLKLLPQLLRLCRVIEIHPQFQQYLVKRVILFLHFLMMTATLLGLPAADECSHIFKDFIGPSEMFEDEVATVYLQEPMISLIFLGSPMPLLDILLLLLRRFQFWMRGSLFRLFLMLLPGQPNVALLSEQRLEVVSRNHLLFSTIGKNRRRGNA